MLGMADLATLQARLARVDAAIQKIEESLTQEHETNGRKHKAPNLFTLYHQRERLEKEISVLSAGNGGGVISHSIVVTK